MQLCKKTAITPSIEIKAGDASAVLDVVRKTGMEHACLIISFGRAALEQMRSLSSGIPLQLVADTISATEIAYAQEIRNCGLDINVGNVTQASIYAAHTAGVAIGAWTTDNYTTIQQLVSWGIDSITSNMVTGGIVR